MSTDSGLSRAEVEATLKNLELLREAKKREVESLKRQYQRMEADLRSAALALHNLNGSILSLEESLGLETGEQTVLVAPEGPGERTTANVDKSRAIMLIIARHNDLGGIGFEPIFKIAQDKGLDIDREYLHTVLNRKRRAQGKLSKSNDKWFLTDKGKQELGIR
jgi:hypothetical protein